MKNLIQILTLLALVAIIAPTVAQAQTDARIQAQAELQAVLPEGVTLETATTAEIEAALDAVLSSLGGEAFADLAGALAAVIADAQPAMSNQAASGVISRVPAARVAGVTNSVASSVAVAVRGRSGAPSTSAIVTAATNAGSARSNQVSAASTARAVIAVIPAARAQIQLDLGLSDGQLTTPAATALGGPASDPLSEIFDIPDNEEASPSTNVSGTPAG